MSALAVAPPRRRRLLERQGMTPEQELELLIAEQAADDTPYVRLDAPDGTRTISLDSRLPDGQLVSDLIGVNEEGELLVFFRTQAETCFDAQKSQHGTIYGYRRLRCRCVTCTAAQNKAVREYRARKRGQS